MLILKKALPLIDISDTHTEEHVKRSEAREKVFKILFQKEFHEDFEVIYGRLLEEEDLKGVQGEYARKTIDGILSDMDEIDRLIIENLTGWTITRLPKTVLTLLRLGIYEIKYNEEIPAISAIDEAVKLSHIYCDEKDSVFINGLLNSIYKKDELHDPGH